MASYTFLTRWHVAAPVERVWAELTRPEEWPAWWSALKRVELLAPGDAAGVGARRRFSWRGRLPYTLTFEMTTTCVDAMDVIEGVAEGELRGRGTWRLRPDGDGTSVEYTWEVEATRWWMRLLDPVARPLFAWNHDQVMRSGEVGLAARLRRPGP